MNLRIRAEFLSFEEITPKKGYQIPALYVIIHRLGIGMRGAREQADPPRRAACSVHLINVQPFPHGVCTRASWSLAMLFAYAR